MTNVKTIIASYRLPRENGQPSVVLALSQRGSDFIFAGGRQGGYTLHGRTEADVRAHWAGYVSNNRGRTVKPAAPRFVEAPAVPDTDLSWLPEGGRGIDRRAEVPCALCGEPWASHRAPSDNSAYFCMARDSRPGDRYVRGN